MVGWFVNNGIMELDENIKLMLLSPVPENNRLAISLSISQGFFEEVRKFVRKEVGKYKDLLMHICIKSWRCSKLARRRSFSPKRIAQYWGLYLYFNRLTNSLHESNKGVLNSHRLVKTEKYGIRK